MDDENPHSDPGDYERHEQEYEEALDNQPAPRTLTAAELFKQRPNTVNAYCPQFVIPGALTLVAGEPKTGKTTLPLYMLDALTRGELFLGKQCSKTSVLYVSEQHSAILREQLVKIPTLAGNSTLHFLPLERNCECEIGKIIVNCKTVDDLDESGHPVYRVRTFKNWQEQVQYWGDQIVKTLARVLVIDTLVSFANLGSDEVNDPGAMTRLFMDLKSLFKTRADLAIVVLHHLRKATGKKTVRSFNDIAGSYALRAATDQNVLIYAPKADKAPNLRRLSLEGRFGPPENIDIELGPSGYRLVDGAKGQPQMAAPADLQKLDELKTNDGTKDFIVIRSVLVSAWSHQNLLAFPFPIPVQTSSRFHSSDFRFRWKSGKAAQFPPPLG